MIPILKAIALVGCILGGCILLVQGKSEAGVALIVVGVEEAWRNNRKK